MSRSITFGIFIASSALLFATNALADCASPTGIKGEFFYNDDYDVMQFCDGTDWIGMSGGLRSRAARSKP